MFLGTFPGTLDTVFKIAGKFIHLGQAVAQLARSFLADAAGMGGGLLKRADGFWAYQLAVVVDDAAQGVTDVVRGADLIDSTPRQIYLQHLLGVPTPRYLHVPVLRNGAGEKLSKQTGALAVTAANEADALAVLQQAAAFLGLALGPAASLAQFWRAALPAWAAAMGAGPAGKGVHGMIAP